MVDWFERVAGKMQQVPGTTVHRDLAAFADHLVGSARGGAGAVASAPREAT